MLLAKPAYTEARLADNTKADKVCHIKGDNPLIWPLLSLLQASNKSWKVHHLAAELQKKGLMQDLDSHPEKALFKRNFLLMNALFNLQSILLPNSYLQVKSMEIQIFRILPNDLSQQLSSDDALRDYYLDWHNYDTCPNVIQEMLASFWSRYEDYIGANPANMHPSHALRVFELDNNASDKDISKQWRRLALKWHPDREGGDPIKFKQVCEAWQTLRRNL
ncbi:DNA-J related domain-containing protein [Shewanella waksmanii]|uniref:DNA-J related domain-containing protein n=1 Tax=Shewanella waksmanii TaxID=213783 RepID=UPI0037362ECF